MIDRSVVLQAPKVVLHDHLDGGLRPATVIELARENGYDGLPTQDPDALAEAFMAGANRKSLVLYLEGFDHTVGVMQTRDAIIRVAEECAEDLAADGVVYAEVRFAPELRHVKGLSLDEVVEAVLEGSIADRRAHASRSASRAPPCAAARSVEIAELAVRHRDQGVVGFDVAGAGGGLPADAVPGRVQPDPPGELPLHDPRRRGVRPAVDLGGAPVVGAQRLGHGVRIVDDIAIDDDGEIRSAVSQLRPRHARAARDVPDLECPHRRCALDRGASHRPAPHFVFASPSTPTIV